MEVGPRDTRLKLEMREDWKKGVTDAEQKSATALLEVAEVKGELNKVDQKRNECETVGNSCTKNQ